MKSKYVKSKYLIAAVIGFAFGVLLVGYHSSPLPTLPYLSFMETPLVIHWNGPVESLMWMATGALTVLICKRSIAGPGDAIKLPALAGAIAVCPTIALGLIYLPVLMSLLYPGVWQAPPHIMLYYLALFLSAKVILIVKAVVLATISGILISALTGKLRSGKST